MSKKTMVVSAVLVMMSLSARGDLVVDQEQPVIRNFIYSVGASRLAQIVTAGMTGSLTRIELPLGCSGGKTFVEIVELDGDLPGTRVLARAEVDGAAVGNPDPPVFYPIDLDRPVRMSIGFRYAIVLSPDPAGPGGCGIRLGQPGDFGLGITAPDLYDGGDAYYDSLVEEGTTWVHVGDGITPEEIGFRTLMEVAPAGGRSNLCLVQGFGPLPFADWVPACRCLQDASLREFRCGLFHPSVFLMRRVPFPIRAGDTFKVQWTLVALGRIQGLVEVHDALPPGFDGPKSPLVFFGEQLQPGQSLTLTYQATAPPKAGTFKVDTSVNLANETGRIETVLEVHPK